MGETGRQPDEGDLTEVRQISRATASALGANRFEADEVAQAVLVKLWMKWNAPHIVRARMRSESRWKAYIRRTTTNVYYDKIREHQRRVARNAKAAAASSLGPGGASSIWNAPIDSREVEAYLARDWICAEILRLPPMQGKVAAYVFLEEMTVPEVAEALGIQDQSVRKSLRAAKATLQKRIGEGEKQRT